MILIHKGYSEIRVSVLILLIPTFILAFVIRKWVRETIFELFLIFFCFAIGLIQAEGIQMIKQGEGYFPPFAILIAISMQFFLSLTLLSRLPWFYCSFGYILIMLYLILRFSSQNEDIPEIFTGSLVMMISYVLMAFLNEKTYREYFSKEVESNMALNKFKEIIQSAIPGALFILNYDENQVEYMNKKADKLLNKLKKKEKHQKIQESLISNDNFSTKRINSQHKARISINIFEKFLEDFKVVLNMNNLDISQEGLNEIIRNFSLRNKKKHEFYKMQESVRENILKLHIVNENMCKTNSQEPFQLERDNPILKSKYYEIKITTINWNNKPCIIIIFHNQTKAQRIIELLNRD